MMRINVIRYARTIEDIPHTPPEKRHSLSGIYENCFAVALNQNYRLVFRVIENENGENIAEILEAKNITQTELSKKTGLSEKLISAIINQKSNLTTASANKISLALGINDRILNSFAKDYNRYLERMKLEEEIEKETDWFKNKFDFKELRKHGIIPNTSNFTENCINLLKFLNVSDKKSFFSYYSNLKLETNFRQTNSIPSTETIAVWLQITRKYADDIIYGDSEQDFPEYNKAAFKKALLEIRKLTVENDFEKIWQEMFELCMRSGVVLIKYPEIKGAKLYGISQWYNKTPVISLSLRQKSNDHFWFTFFHEAGHIILHSKKTIIDIESCDKQIEKEADHFAMELLYQGKAHYENFKKSINRKISKEEIIKFAEELNIHPGIPVGALQHDKIIPFDTLNELKTKIGF
jgi:transcriptional regulator with XRE-family HTH domain